MNVMIGVDPHKGSHTALSVGDDEETRAQLRVRAGSQVAQLLEWAEPFEKRTWAIESAGGLGYLLAQQLVAAGEQVLDVPATLAVRVRVLGTGKSNKNGPNDARSVAVAALRAPGLTAVRAEDHRTILRMRGASRSGSTQRAACASGARSPCSCRSRSRIGSRTSHTSGPHPR